MHHHQSAPENGEHESPLSPAMSDHDTSNIHSDHTLMHHVDTTRAFDDHGNLKLSSMGGTNENTPFCKAMHNGGGMIMYMDGFRYSLKGDQTCLNLLFPSWTLDSRIKFGGAMVGVFFAAFLLEGFSKLRHKVVHSAKKKRRGRSKYSRIGLRTAVTVLHGLQALFGYGLMLVTMTFSIELLLATITGLACGYAFYFQGSFFGDSSDDMESHHVTSNPCCEFMVEESREVPGTPSDGGSHAETTDDVLLASASHTSEQHCRRVVNGTEQPDSQLTDPLIEPPTSV